jgi:aspartate/methionine/tyrosine aminotransferase
LLEAGAFVRAQIQKRVRANAEVLRRCASSQPACTCFPVEAGWYSVIQIPAVKSEEDFVNDLLERTGVLVYPGYFFDFHREAFLVVSLLPEPAVFSSAIATLFAEISSIS